MKTERRWSIGVVEAMGAVLLLFVLASFPAAQAGQFPDRAENESAAFTGAVLKLSHMDAPTPDAMSRVLAQLGFAGSVYTGKSGRVEVNFAPISMEGELIDVEYKPAIPRPLPPGLLSSIGARAKTLQLLGPDLVLMEVDGVSFLDEEYGPRDSGDSWANVRRQVVVRIADGAWTCSRAVLSWKAKK